jgi:hypothetical protein
LYQIQQQTTEQQLRDDLFDSIAEAKANNKSDNFRDGKGLAVVEGCLYDKMNDGMTFVARFKVLESSSKGDLDPKTRQPVVPNAPGSMVGWPQKIEKHKSAPGNVKAFTLNLLGYEESEVNKDRFKEAFSKLVGKEQFGRGMLVRFETYQQAVQKGARAGEVNTYVRFVHVPPTEETAFGKNDKDGILARRAELDGGSAS